MLSICLQEMAHSALRLWLIKFASYCQEISACIGGSKGGGARDVGSLLCSSSFIFMQFSAIFLSNNRLVHPNRVLVSPSGKPPLTSSWLYFLNSFIVFATLLNCPKARASDCTIQLILNCLRKKTIVNYVKFHQNIRRHEFKRSSEKRTLRIRFVLNNPPRTSMYHLYY